MSETNNVNKTVPEYDEAVKRAAEHPDLDVLTCVALRGVSIFPHTVVHFDIGREKSIRALERAMTTDKLMYVSTQKDESILIPAAADMYEIGTVVRVKQMLKIQGDAVRVLVEGICRARIDEVLSEDSYISGVIQRIEENITEDDARELESLMKEF